ncbi:MAG: LacI family DNA-binding transcriptional regulator [Rhodobacteraceae bacterium]|nr:LacI family DNA-binding transcriptional regulator [Paracoccaceae bacterium]
MVTINDVSKRAGASRSTVSRYISNNGYVSEAAREAIEAAIRELGYRPNGNARALRSNRTNIFGGVVTDLASPFYAQLVSGLQMACKSAGKGLLLTSGVGDPVEEERAILELLDRSCDGLLLNLEYPLSKGVRTALVKAGLPFVLIGCGTDASAAGAVRLENRLGARQMMDHLLGLGHRHVLHISGSAQHPDTIARVEGIHEALKAKGLPMESVTIAAGQFSEDHGYDTVKRLFAKGRPFTAIFGGDDDIAAGALMALKEQGLRIPDDVSVVGFDDNFHARHLSPPLTTVNQPIGEAGSHAVGLLIGALEDRPTAHRDVILPTHFVHRASTAPASQP